MKLHLIFSRTRNGVIGRGGDLVWRDPKDMANLKRATMGHPVIMGRKTWDSIPAKFRPLPGRGNIVVTRDAGWSHDGARRAGSLQEAIALAQPAADAWLIGGAELYRQAEPLADSALVTEVDADFEGDAMAPEFGPGWHETAREAHVAADGTRFAFVTYHHEKTGG